MEMLLPRLANACNVELRVPFVGLSGKVLLSGKMPESWTSCSSYMITSQWHALPSMLVCAWDAYHAWTEGVVRPGVAPR
jgi:hypothetical protein